MSRENAPGLRWTPSFAQRLAKLRPGLLAGEEQMDHEVLKRRQFGQFHRRLLVHVHPD